MKEAIKQWLFVLAGSALIAISFVFFFTPYQIVPGGVYGIGIVLNHLFPSIGVGMYGLFFDIPLLLISFFIFGGKFGSKTVVSALITPVMIDSLTWLVSSGTSKVLDPTQMLGGVLDLSNDMMLTCIFGGLLMGLGSSLILKSHATSGGTDTIAMIVSKYAKMPVSKSILFVDSSVVLFGLIVFGDWKMPLYSLIIIFAMSKVIDLVLEGSSNDKLIFIISEEEEKIRDFIIDDLGRGGTFIKSAGMYSKAQKEMIFVVISRPQLPLFKDFVRKQDPKAFMVVVNAHETLGDGFKQFTQHIGG